MIETATALPADHSMWALFLQADSIVKGVMVLLLVASIACWTVVFDKLVRLAVAHRAARRFSEAVKSGGPIDGVESCEGIAREIVAQGVRAACDQDSSESRAERRNRVERAMRAAMIEQLKRLESGIPLLATVGSTAPFVGLFGTVWGIMNSFTAIAASKDTSLAVVAPGIAEALLATALGLVAAIPAVIAYNKLSGSLSDLAHRLSLAIGELGDRWSRRAADQAAALTRRNGAPFSEAAE
jgi:biopolymer transport protein TolQ